MTPQVTEQMLKDTFGVPVVFGETSTWGHDDPADDSVLTAAGRPGYTGEDRKATVATGIIPDLAIDEPITVDGVDYVVRWFGRRQSDGGLTDILLAKG